jgi:N-acetyl-gamma-glutamyl-phosphate reductase
LSRKATDKLRVAVLGASGYSGAELVRALLGHPFVELAALGGDSTAGRKLSELYPSLRGLDLELEKFDAAALKGRVDLAFLCLPHVQSMVLGAPLVRSGIKVVDLSGDFRLKDAALYEKFYKHAHTEPELLKEAVYGLPELHASDIRKARLVANPGCYTTTSILGAYPLLKAGKIKPDSIIIDAKSGVSGMGRKLVEASQFAEIYDNFSAYSVGGGHRHIPEIEQELSAATGGAVSVSFTPHLLPLSRGILATIYADLVEKADEEALLKITRDFYAAAPFVRVYGKGELPSLRSVRGTNFCDIGLKVDSRCKRAIIISCTDNLGKGAAFQAIQNMNLMQGWPEDEGLKFSALTT